MTVTQEGMKYLYNEPHMSSIVYDLSEIKFIRLCYVENNILLQGVEKIFRFFYVGEK